MQETTSSLINEFLNDLTRRGYSFNTIKAYRQALKMLELHELDAITTSDLMSKLSNNWEASTVSARQAAIKSFFKWLKDTNRIEYNPAEGLGRIRQKEALPRPIPENDLNIILDTAKKLPIMPRVYFFLLADLGLRADEGLSLDVNDIHWEKGQEGVLVRHGKGKRERLVPFNWNMPCANMLKRLCLKQKSGPLFTTLRKERATYDWAYYWWSKLMEECNMDYTIHQLRHSAITGWVRSGINIMAARRMAGHKLLQTTERYTQITDNDLRNELGKLATDN
ncbi:MAG: tyrosine-type recombinase/integrase [Syntrophomonadaceae bacterium]|nr:tyrosine-type recombinase/integrase [Syntrophomonadaceae bacterium]